MPTRAALAIAHLEVRLRPLNRALRAAVARQAAVAARLDRPDLTPYCITDEQVGQLLDHVEPLLGEPAAPGPAGLPVTEAERADEAALRERAAAAGLTLPLDELAGQVDLTPGEQDALLLCAAPELDRAYERIFAYVLDDLNRRLPCAELLCAVTAGPAGERLARRQLLGRAGRLRRLGLLQVHGTAPTELRQELRLAPGVADFLLGSGADLAVLAHDPGAVAIPPRSTLPPHVDGGLLERLGKALHAGDLDLVGVWGAPRAGQHEVVLALAQAAGLPLRRVPAADLDAGPAEMEGAVGGALAVAAALGAVLWIPVERLDGDERRQALDELLARSRTPACLSGSSPWRPGRAICRRAWAEVEVAEPGWRHRQAMWAAALPDLDDQAAGLAGDLAARYRIGGDELRAVAALARGGGPVGGNGQRGGDALVSRVEQAAAAIVHRPAAGFARAIRPRRGPEDLVLPADQFRTVREVAATYRAWPRVAETWGFARHGGAGVKALFTGEPGTGKTLAAEVVAGMLDLVLLKVDLAQVVSKWVGETERNLESAFQQAEACHAVLFFDEADALFGRRGEIRHGVDRYANLEVGFLLQRLEQSDSLVVLASNLKENIDPAFTRRFHYIVHFPRPRVEERRRIWRLGFPLEAPLAPDVDLDALAELDMTGAAIVGAARTAALLAADAASPAITAAHIVAGVSRQFQRDARLLRPGDLGRYADLLQEDANSRQGHEQQRS